MNMHSNNTEEIDIEELVDKEYDELLIAFIEIEGRYPTDSEYERLWEKASQLVGEQDDALSRSGD